MAYKNGFGIVIQLAKYRNTPRQTWEEGIQTILKERGTEWKGIRATARARDRWRAVCKPTTPTGRESEVK